MSKYRMTYTDTREIKNILYPTFKRTGIWQRFTRFLAKTFSLF